MVRSLRRQNAGSDCEDAIGTCGRLGQTISHEGLGNTYVYPIHVGLYVRMPLKGQAYACPKGQAYACLEGQAM